MNEEVIVYITVMYMYMYSQSTNDVFLLSMGVGSPYITTLYIWT